MSFYERKDGTIVEVYGSTDKILMLKILDKNGDRISSSCNKSDMDNWKLRKDLNDFPGAKDPRLPYEFDLMYDIKYVSDLKRELEYNQNVQELKILMQKYNIKI